MPRIDREAGPATAVAAVPAALALLLRAPRVAAVLGVLPVAVAAFFRDPDRTPDTRPADVDDVLSPADGKVMYAGPGQEGVAPPGEWQQVSIFLSAFDVHMNRAPYGGRVVEVVRRPGKWLAAYKHESAHLNERSDITVEREVDGELRRVHFRQIVGLMARRVVTRVAVGDELATGERIGLMKFGSRMDVFVPAGVRGPHRRGRAGRRRRERHRAMARPGHRPAHEQHADERAAHGSSTAGGSCRPPAPAVVSLRQIPKRERARLLAPSAFTTLNMISGFSSVLLAFRGHFTLAAVLIAFSIVMDIADGFVARLVGATSPFGLQLDSLADLISFGVAPAVLVHTWALRRVAGAAPGSSRFLWLSCAAFRLARFNVTIDPAADKRYFVGLPSPGGGQRGHRDDLRPRLPVLRPGHRPVAGLVPAPRAASSRPCSW